MTALKLNLFALILAMILLGPLARVAAADKSSNSEIETQQKTAQIQKLLADTLIDTKDFPKEMTLSKFLAALEKKLPEGKKISIRIDEKAFGKQMSQIANATVRCSNLKDESVATVLRLAMSQISREKVDFAIRPTEVIITQPQRAAHRMVYDVRDIIEQMPTRLSALKKQYPDVWQGLKPTDGPALLARFLMNEVKLQPWEMMEVVNGSQLKVLASPTRHEELIDGMKTLRLLSDLAVGMNARLYEVDRAFFTKHVAPLFYRDKDAEEHPLVLPINGALFKRISQQKELLQSEESKLRPDQVAPFLSHESVFRYSIGPHPSKEGETLIGTGMAGVSFEVLPLVSRDRRYLRLKISQKIAQLVRIDKTKKLDLSTGKEVELEAPNLRENFLTGTIQIEDGTPILMPVDYRPPGKGNEDKIWLLMARPFIWIEAEVKERGFSPSESVWESAGPEEKIFEVATPLPDTDKTKQILQAIITDVLTNPDFKKSRHFYGTEKDKTLAPIYLEKWGWPKEFKPEIHGYSVIPMPQDPFSKQNRVLGIRIDKFDLKQKKTSLFDTPIEVSLSNVGGSDNGAVIGGLLIHYVPNRVGKRWTVECEGFHRP